MTLSRKLVAEFIGTFAYVFIGVLAVCNNVTLLGIALANGLVFAVMVSALAHISGGHFNPALTVGAWAGGRIRARDALLYIITQLIGAYIAVLAVKSIIPAPMYMAEGVNLGLPSLGPTMNFASGVFLELILTFFLVLVYFGTVVDAAGPKTGGLFVGLSVVLGMLAGGPLTKVCMNPARAFGPALAIGDWTGQSLYWIGPLLGGILAGVMYRRWIGKEGAVR